MSLSIEHGIEFGGEMTQSLSLLDWSCESVSSEVESVLVRQRMSECPYLRPSQLKFSSGPSILESLSMTMSLDQSVAFSFDMGYPLDGFNISRSKWQSMSLWDARAIDLNLKTLLVAHIVPPE